MRLINELESCLIVLLSLIVVLGVFGREANKLGDTGHANCPEGWISNGEKTRCFKLVTFDRPRTFSHGFKACNDLGGTEVETRRRNGSKETSEYPVTLASVYKLSDEEAIRRTLVEQGDVQKTANGCFVGLRKYAFFRYPPGWYWIDSGSPISARDSEINWTSSYNASWLLRFKFPFEKCGFFDIGGLGRRPCWLIDSELSCAVCGTVAYDSGGLNPNKYSELIKQTDEIISKEPKLDFPGYNSLNCTDVWENDLSFGLCQNVSNILDSAWSSYQSSINFPSINFNWKEEPSFEGRDQAHYNSYLELPKYKQKKTFYWDQDPEAVPALSEEMKFIGLSAQPTYQPLDRNTSGNFESADSGSELENEGRGDILEEMVYKQSSDSIEDILMPVTKPILSNSASVERSSGVLEVYPSNIPVVSSKKAAIPTIATSSANSFSKTNTTSSSISSSTSTTTNTTTTNTTRTTTTTMTTTTTTTTETTTTTKATTKSTTTSSATTTTTNVTTTLKSGFYTTSKLLYTPKMENVRTSTYVKRNSNTSTANNTIRKDSGIVYMNSEKEVENSLLGFGAGEYVNSESDDSRDAQDLSYLNELGQVKMEKSVEGHFDVIERTVNKKLIIGVVIGILLILLILMFCCVLFLRRRSDDSESAQNIDNSNKEVIRSKLNSLQLASIKPILARKGSKIVHMGQKSISYDSNMAPLEKKSIVSVEDTTFSPEYMNSGECGEGAKTVPYYVAQSQANTLQLHSGRNINLGYDTRTQSQKQTVLKSPKYHDFFYSEPSR
ncbi:C-type lectin-like domain containing [Cryptosporidium sp. chipmunk genotype I]|uniref:C-type lectin-like domain containing n=1 Tax=Cryptosporidium sp. chipmunk genotype I TaxID=1280935 RepID=UPI00351A87C9|nr:C-type lectin-like domain containing [Cryptosporidium sp. chipmunk genotype I]